MEHYPFALKELPYAYDALTPVLSADTLHFHHDKHLNAYVTNLNKALEGCSACQNLTLPELLANLDQVPEAARTAVRNNGGGVFNHELYFSTLRPQNGGSKPSEALSKAIADGFGSVEEMLGKLKAAAVGRFGSGWAYVVADKAGKLFVCSTLNQDVPDLKNLAPIMTVDVWEHAYYLDFQNRRPDYCSALMSLLDWDKISVNYETRVFVK